MNAAILNSYPFLSDSDVKEVNNEDNLLYQNDDLNDFVFNTKDTYVSISRVKIKIVLGKILHLIKRPSQNKVSSRIRGSSQSKSLINALGAYWRK